MVGFDGTEIPSDVIADVEQGRVGGLIFFTRNFEDADHAVQLCGRASELAAPAPLLLGVDQEGGRVQRLKSPFPQLPPMAELGRTGRKTVARAAGALLARSLRHVGMHVDFAPVLDVHTRADNPVIGDRSFGADPSAVARLGAAFIDGLQSGGVAACGKHFPGHGDTTLDSHLALPTVDASLDVLRQRELVPFRAAVASEVAAVMSAHVVYPQVDAQPATLSSRWLRQELRGELGFEGLIVSDDLEMQAIAGRQTLGEAAVAAVGAGCDLLLVCSRAEDRREIFVALSEAVGSGRLSPVRAEAAVARVQAFKKTWVRPRAPSSWSDLALERQALLDGLQDSPSLAQAPELEFEFEGDPELKLDLDES